MADPTNPPPDGDTISTASEPEAVAEKQVAADQEPDDLNPDAAVLAHPEWGGITTLAMAASFGSVVPSAVAAAYGNLFWTMELHGDGSLANGGGPLDLRSDAQIAEEKEEKENDFVDALIEVAEERREREQREADLQATRSEAEIDAMPWIGDPDAVWSFGDVKATRAQWLAGAKASRQNLKKRLDDGSITEDQYIHQTRLLSDLEIATKQNDQDKVAQIREELASDPASAEILADLDGQTRHIAQRATVVSAATSREATGINSDAEVSTSARADLKMQMVLADQPKPTPSAAPVALSQLPASAPITPKFAEAASPPVVDTPVPEPTKVAAATPALNTSLDI